MKLWYQQPAAQWTQALPLGNGRIGAMVYGDPVSETISLNEDTLWSGHPRNTLVPNAATGLEKAAHLTEEGHFSEAGAVLDQQVLGAYTQSYLPFGDLRLHFDTIDPAAITGYVRALDLQTAVHHSAFTANGVRYETEAFVSAPDQVLVLRLTASSAAALHLRIGFDCKLRHGVCAEENTLTLTGLAPSYIAPSYLGEMENAIVYEEADDQKGMRFIGQAVAEASGGTVAAAGDTLRISAADTVEIRVFLHTSYNGFDRSPYTEGKDERALLESCKKACQKQSYQALLSRHLADYEPLYRRVSLSFEGGAARELPTDVRLRQFKTHRNDPRLYEMIFQYGRYLTIACSRPGTQAANLQGIWSHHLRAPWSSNYTLNINTEMNYWPTEAVNLPECHAPLFDLVDKLCRTGGEAAAHYYRADGAVAHHNSDLWGLATPVGQNTPGMYGCCFWNHAFGWLTRHLFEHYEYSLDRAFLAERAYPVIRAAAQFYLDCLTRTAEGTLPLTPATSPENAFLYKGEIVKLSKAATMGTAIMREVFQHTLDCCALLSIDSDFAEQVRAACSLLPPYKIGSKGQMLEWDEEFEEAEPHHRHISHLYPLYPAEEAAPHRSPALANACKRALELRGDSGTGWSLGWKINEWARLGDGDHALELLKNQLRLVEDDAAENYSDGGGTYANLFDAHPPFQIDGNFAACAGICEMLVQCSGQDIYLLPALPKALPTGSLRGLRVKGGMTLDLAFADGALTTAVFRPAVSAVRTVRFHYAGKAAVRTVSGGDVVLTPDSFS